MSQTSDQVRKGFAESDARRDAGMTAPQDVVCFNDIVYGEDPRWQSLDVYRPRAAEGKMLPVIVSVHGGGWVYGDKETYRFYCMSLAQRGFAVVNFSYRLAPEHKFPAPLEDTNSALTWLVGQAEKYGMDTAHVFAVGDSAGANILGLYACMCTNPSYAARYDFQPPAGFVPTAMALNCGAYVISRATDADGKPDLNTLLMGDFLPDGGTEAELAKINVLRHITSDFPPVFCTTSTMDFLKDQMPLLTAVLMGKDVPYVSRFYVDRAAPLKHVFMLNIRLEAAKQCNDEECAFFREFLA